MSSAPWHQRVLVDAGPLVALLRRNDIHLQLCSDTLRQIQAPLLTSWPVITEAAWLLRNLPRSLERLYQGAASGVLSILPTNEQSLPAIDALRLQFLGLNPQLADLSLLYLAHRENIQTVFTLDRRDFIAFQSVGPLNLLPDSFSV